MLLNFTRRGTACLHQRWDFTVATSPLYASYFSPVSAVWLSKDYGISNVCSNSVPGCPSRSAAGGFDRAL